MFKLEEIPIKVILLPTLYCQTISQQSKLKFVKTLVCQNFSLSKRALRENWEGCHDEPDLQFFFIHLVATVFWLQVINWKTKPTVSQLWPSDYDDDDGDDIREDDDGVYLPRNSFPCFPLVICQRNLWVSLRTMRTVLLFCLPKLESNTSCLVRRDFTCRVFSNRGPLRAKPPPGLNKVHCVKIPDCCLARAVQAGKSWVLSPWWLGSLWLVRFPSWIVWRLDSIEVFWSVTMG